MIVKIIRLEETAQGTIGALLINNSVHCYTLERPYLFNKRDISCIPPGQYICKSVKSPRFGKTYEVCDVPGRSHILFHSGNTINDSSGCILLGQQIGHLNHKRAVLSSRTAVADFLDKMRDIDECPIYIRSVFNGD